MARRHTVGRGRSHAVKGPASEAKLRAALLAYLGMPPEDPSQRRGRYSSSTPELVEWVREKSRARKGQTPDTWREAG